MSSQIPETNNGEFFESRGYSSIGSFQYDRSVDDMLSEPAGTYIAPARAVDVSDLFDASKSPPELGKTFRAAFFLDMGWVFLNHGAFGGAARPALRAAQRWAEYAETQPLRWFDRELFPLLAHSIRAAAALIRAPPANVALVPHATYALSSVIGSLLLQPGDVIFCLDVGYGSVKKMLSAAAERSGARLVVGAVPFPLTTPASFVDAIAAQIPLGATLAVFDHVTSNAGLLLPVAALVAAAHERAARVLVDGAHGLGALDLDVPAIGADYYITNAHKWFASSKGLAVLYVAPWVLAGKPGPADAPLALTVARPPAGPPRAASISHGFGSGFGSEFIWDGCRDYSAAVALPSLLDWWSWVGIERSRDYCRALLAEGIALLCARWGTAPHAPAAFYSHMACVQLPARAMPRGAFSDADGGIWRSTSTHSKMIQDALHHAFSIEVPAKTLPGPDGGADSRTYVRVSAFVYNSIEDFLSLADAVDRINWVDHVADAAEDNINVSAVATGGGLQRLHLT